MSEDAKDLLKFVTVVAGGTLLFMYTLFGIVNHLKFDARLAMFEQLRSDTHASRYYDYGISAHDVIGQATEANRKLVYRQTWNQKWYADLLVHDGWEFVEPIEVGE